MVAAKLVVIKELTLRDLKLTAEEIFLLPQMRAVYSHTQVVFHLCAQL